MATVIEKINELVEQLPPDRQEWVLEYLQRLTQTRKDHYLDNLPRTPLPPGTPSSVLLNFKVTMPLEAAEAMERALEDCERIEPV
jgi:hypothetical protein